MTWHLLVRGRLLYRNVAISNRPIALLWSGREVPGNCEARAALLPVFPYGDGEVCFLFSPFRARSDWICPYAVKCWVHRRQKDSILMFNTSSMSFWKKNESKVGQPWIDDRDGDGGPLCTMAYCPDGKHPMLRLGKVIFLETRHEIFEELVYVHTQLSMKRD